MWKIQKGYDSVSKSFRLPVELVDELDKLAYENNLSLNQLVIQCLNRKKIPFKRAECFRALFFYYGF